MSKSQTHQIKTRQIIREANLPVVEMQLITTLHLEVVIMLGTALHLEVVMKDLTNISKEYKRDSGTSKIKGGLITQEADLPLELVVAQLITTLHLEVVFMIGTALNLEVATQDLDNIDTILMIGIDIIVNLIIAPLHLEVMIRCRTTLHLEVVLLTDCGNVNVSMNTTVVIGGKVVTPNL
ncbi:hypothetical protein MHU86_5085 [Fragilaria crotonensis]|nr:hypothetical protein MHU86_5085 [Fragilaria crotonensis]